MSKPVNKIADAKRIAEAYEKKMVIILMLDDETLEYASYGKTKVLCEQAKNLANTAYDVIVEKFK